ncbi:hypothetical protein [Solibacillus sp. FSL W8-0372]|uniref:hypothetical protein n=1 Tax=Solibacillus sp. FSL W8-0372 TaxID=2921713 RepID=UPI0030CC4560
MKKNLKMGLMAGLLITPAIVAQAGEVQASETSTPFNVVASITAEELLNSFKVANEGLPSDNIEQIEQGIKVERTKFNTMSDDERTILGDSNVKLIDTKIKYLEGFIEARKDAVSLSNLVGKLTTKNKNLVSDTNQALVELQDLKDKLNKLSTDLSTAASEAVLTSTDFLSTLKYYDGNGEGKFIEQFVTRELIEKLDDKKEDVEKIDSFMKDSITPIIIASQANIIIKDTYVSAVEIARKAFSEIPDTEIFKETLKIQIVKDTVGIEQFIKDAELDITKAKSVEDKIEAIKVNPPTATTFNSKVTAIVTEYEKLSALQKALVTNYEDMESYNNALKIVTEITRLSKLASNSDILRLDLPNVVKVYEELSTVEKDFITNADKIIEMQTSIEKAIAVEGKITAIKVENATTAVTDARKAYNDLSPTERKYVLKEALELLTSWEKSSSTAANVIKLIEGIKTDILLNLDDKNLADTKKLSSVTSFVTKVRSAESSYSKVIAEHGKPETNEQKLITNRARLEALMPIANIADQVAKLKVTSATYADDLLTAQNTLNDWDTIKSAIPLDDAKYIEKLHGFLKTHLQALKDEQALAVKLDADILTLKNATSIDLQQIFTIRETYNSLSSNGKRLVKNIKTLTELERANKVALDTIKAIDAIDVKAKDFARKTTTVETSYNKLTAPMKAIVYNYAKLEELLPIAKLMQEIDAIRPTAKDFKEKLSTAKNKFDELLKGYTVPTDPTTNLDIIKTKLHTDYGQKLTEFQAVVTSASTIEQRIDALQTKSGEGFITDLAEVSTLYKGLDSTAKRNVSNAKLLTDLERDYKASLRVIEQINKLPVHTDRSYSNKVSAAQKAYDRLTDKQKRDVFNYDSKLKNILKAANLIDRIEKLRVGSKTYEIDVAAIRAEYALLSPTEQELVHNITKLATAELGVSNAKEVMALIDIAIPTAENYIQKLIDARNGYDSLSKSDQKLVMNYKDLTTRERAVKPVLKLDSDILALDPSNARTFISKYNAAGKAYEKLSISERALLLNTEQFLGDFTSIFKVMNAINSIKPSSKTFVEETQAARALFNVLPANLVAKISNLATLQEHELNVEGGAKVDAMIRALNTVPPNEFISKIKEAREAFKSLNSANKKGVTLESELKEQEKYIKPIEAAIKAIDGLSNPRNDLSRQFNTVNNALKKLDDKQKQYVTNMDQYSNLSNVIHVYTLIAGLKPNDKYFQGNMEAAKLAYDRLSEEEKLKVTNYYKLQQAVLDMTEVQKVTTIIASLNSTSSNFETDVTEALAAYKALPSGSKRQVLNYSDLQQAERDLKAAQRVIKQIDDLDSTLRTYASRAKSAKTAYERLTVNQKALVKNYNKLQAAIFDLGL